MTDKDTSPVAKYKKEEAVRKAIPERMAELADVFWDSYFAKLGQDVSNATVTPDVVYNDMEKACRCIKVAFGVWIRETMEDVKEEVSEKFYEEMQKVIQGRIGPQCAYCGSILTKAFILENGKQYCSRQCAANDKDF